MLGIVKTSKAERKKKRKKLKDPWRRKQSVFGKSKQRSKERRFIKEN